MTNSTTKLVQIANKFWHNLDKTDKEVLECVECGDYQKTTHRLHDVIFIEIKDYDTLEVSYHVLDINF